MPEDAQSPRRSGRKRKRNSKYTTDTFYQLVHILDGTETNDAPDGDSTFADVAHGSDNDVDVRISESSESEAFSEAGDADHDDASNASDVTDDVEITNQSGSERLGRKQSVNKAVKMKSRKVRSLNVETGDELRSRGVQYVFRYAAKDVNVAFSFGGTEKDVLPILHARSKWFNEITIPLRHANASGCGGMRYSFYQTVESREIEANQGWDWYFKDGGMLAFQRSQKLQPVESTEVEAYLPPSSQPKSLLTSVSACQAVFKLQTGQSMFATSTSSQNSDPGAFAAKLPSGTLNEHGWIFNVGASVQCLDWATNQTDESQYLAVSTLPRPSYRPADSRQAVNPLPRGANTSAFNATPLTADAIQIWRIDTAISGNGSTQAGLTPTLRLVICSDWGGIKQLKWCPAIKASRRDLDSQQTIYLGLLAVLYGDGKVRVLDVSFPKTTVTATSYFRITEAAFVSCPPDTVCTCIAWLSSNHVAAGCANGYVVVWDLGEHFQDPNPPVNAVPCFYEPFHTTYILNISSCRPSRPHLLMTSSVDGHVRLTSLLAPSSDCVMSPRNRIGTQSLAWHDHIQHAIYGDDAYLVRALNVRKFYQSMTIARQGASILSIATSPVHSCVLIGGADGAVSAINPMRKVLGTRARQADYRQVWFQHDWRRGRPSASTQNNDSDAANGDGESGPAATPGDLDTGESQLYAPGDITPHPMQPLLKTHVSPPPSDLDFPTGLSRFTSGFKVENLQQAESRKGGKPKATAARVADSGTVFTTIHEEETGVRCLSWNPNLHVGAWAAAGLGSGLVFVQDLAWG